ncbi:hypothetical protein AB751O23_AC_00340 [Chlamydiales bacterium SCGC AB-751-O23]|jgi:HEAT repeat protein|nr:hypothetical protein AB751O23_AC_00340 [Chlamydiales bacterium SCGC AB-751-O23]
MERLIFISFFLLFFSSCQTHYPPTESPEIKNYLNPFTTSPTPSPSQELLASSKSLLIHQGKIENILKQIREDSTLPPLEKRRLLTQVSQKILKEAILSKDFDDNSLGFYGAFISLDPQVIDEMSKQIPRIDPRLQLMVLNFLDQLQEDSRHQAVEQLLASPYPLLKIEAAFYLASSGDPKAFNHLEALFYKSSPEYHYLFSKAFVALNVPRSEKFTQRLLYHTEDRNRGETIRAIAEYKKTSFYRDITALSREPSPLTQEACAYALGRISQLNATKPLFTLAKNPHHFVKLAALHSLLLLEEESPKKQLLEHAQSGSLYAYHLLPNERESKKFLKQMTYNNDSPKRNNAAIALLHLKDPECIYPLLNLLLIPSDERALLTYSSPGKTLLKWEHQTVRRLDQSSSHFLINQSFYNKQALFKKARLLPNSSFFWLCDQLLKKQKSDWIPHIISILQTDSSEEATELLKKHLVTPGAPLLRSYCHLALFNKEGGQEHLAEIIDWIKENQMHQILQLREMPQWDEKQKYPFQLSPKEKSQFLIDAYLTISDTHSDIAIDLLVEGLLEGARKNRPILAGLLLNLLK